MTSRIGRRPGGLALVVLLLGLFLLLPAPVTATGRPAAGRPMATRWIVSLRQPAARSGMAQFQQAVGDAGLTRLSGLQSVYLANFDRRTHASDGIARLLADPSVRYVEPDTIYHYLWTPNDPLFPEETWTKTVDLPDAWSLATGKLSTVVAVVDSGIQANHPDLKGKVLAGYDFFDNDTNVTDNVGHGTAVAGIIAARGNDGIGVAGAAMDVSILPVKVGNADGAPVSAIAEGVRYATDHGASVINLSLGSDTPSATLQDAISYAYSKNVVVVAAAGNHADQVSFPASYTQTISVGASNLAGTQVADFSSHLSRVDLAAPGEGIATSYWDATDGDTWAAVDGTSFSTPIVSGTVALMRSVNPGMSIEAIRNALTSTARKTFSAGTPGVGAGLLDANEALRHAMLPEYAATWQIADQPVDSGAASRSWLWGPYAFAVTPEQYQQTQHGQRLVAYFDKARMEITNPYGDQTSPWYITNGLLATEMISGQMQVGDNQFVQKSAAQIPVAGDPDDTSGPTYASFTGLLGASPLAAGTQITQALGRDGTVGNDAHYAQYGVTGADLIPETNHRVASIFASYLRSNGLVLKDGTYQNGPLFSPAFYATGFPITEAYWSRVKVAGTVRDVLVQCFQRRCLTYTPSNPSGWQVEMANVGQHYYRWRYGPPPTKPAPDDPTALAQKPK